MNALSKLLGRFFKAWKIYVIRPIQIAWIGYRIEHIIGPLSVDYGPDELVILCLLRDSELYINSFMKHYIAMGVKHIFLLDNGSADRSLELACQYPNMTIVRSFLPFKRYKMAMRHYLINRFAGKNRWSLYVDIDEFWDYPYSDVVNLPSLLQYLNRHSFTAVISYMLDMFSDIPLKKIQSTIDDDITQQFRYYDLSGIVKMDYYFPNNELPTQELKAYFGGIRRTIFTPGEIRFTLTKHPLFYLDGKLMPLFTNEHHIRGAKIADITCTLFHYKFLGDFSSRTIRAVREENYHSNSIAYKQYSRVLQKTNDLVLMRETAKEISSVNDLVKEGFLYVSDDYADWINDKGVSTVSR